MKVQRGRTLALIFGLCLLMALACQMPINMANGDEPQETAAQNPTEAGVTDGQPAADQTIEITAEALAEALARETTDERSELLALLGRPDAFKISILEVEGGQIRRESWWYFAMGTQVDFVDGEVVWTMEVAPALEGSIFPAWYDPLAFEPGMSAVSAIQVVAEASPAGAAPEIVDVSDGGQDLAGGLILVGDQILIGIQDDRLVYVETVPMFAEEG
jgi:hypothetical protein